ncbi:MAG: 16S rRNA (adenine(1518)-N(6)/adenine(1519)-N(6))-dimethyltransferase RsmA [Xanthomonadales bacterium]|jgi:16S rRNA (adenine1518-N6/adenine1519-N6)-dimethyltransferase|nr:16S rRNA (adenine(1518)-N(6)/adenine(1519)-N(6))-dimethyltransferase RsmA [Xanthomonadales bacterium]MDH3924581.1 16S rRNA (adenine(1518)-N(6)/adenine(1519)-N(6))-dimethyltransferase RsmA [Xanthomonadales bacterium]MDH3940782.1 16S rRNA (adenine(1518)-N(6)/adenine(1519)-N(6))-dimethyltransferase RsmA [Xanthomonadales bacterium]MDH4001293.1 16S rRNA (adenine(1518)-N(6)/adenine(1519)-N(6))-dimethyltransferase RsmA [Xanthomonadales bacterium]
MEHRARKRFGQNFLTDKSLIQRIVNTINPAAGELILEIGPGQAAISKPLAESGAELHLLEIDRDLVARLKLIFEPMGLAKVHQGDALKMDYSDIVQNRAFRLVGNLPYNISTPLIFHVLQWNEQVIDMHFMLQQEVVRRMAAEPGGKAWGKLSVMCQYYCEVAPLFNVPPEAFSPAPKVESMFVRLVPHRQPPVAVGDMTLFERLVSQAFSMRRKTLRNCLRGMLDAEQIESCGIDPGARPETLGLEQFAALTRRLEGIH